MSDKSKIYNIVLHPEAVDLQNPAEYVSATANKIFADVGNDCDAILVTIDASDDEAHEAALDALKAFCAIIDLPVIGTEDIRRMEDVKKLLYAGCERAALDEQALKERQDMVSEVVGKFGTDRLAAILTSSDTDTAMIPENMPVMRPASGNTDLSANGIIEFSLDEGISRRKLVAAISWDELKKGSDGLVPVVVQDHRSDEVLMVAYMNEEAYNMTIETGRMTYYSRSRQELWIKGETSGHYQYVRSLKADCDKDTILAKVRQIGAACHTGARSCFFNDIAETDDRSIKNPMRVLQDVYGVIADRKVHPKEGSYTNYLFDKGIDKILKKCGEEATEIVIAAKNPNDNEIIYEISDFLYHVMVLMVEKGVTWEEVTDELARR